MADYFVVCFLIEDKKKRGTTFLTFQFYAQINKAKCKNWPRDEILFEYLIGWVYVTQKSKVKIAPKYSPGLETK